MSRIRCSTGLKARICQSQQAEFAPLRQKCMFWHSIRKLSSATQFSAPESSFFKRLVCRT